MPWFAIGIFLMFVMIEMIPILSKVLQPRGPYDIILSAENDVAEKKKQELLAAIEALDLSEERKECSDAIKASIIEILADWKTHFDKSNYSEQMNDFFQSIYNTFFAPYNQNYSNDAGKQTSSTAGISRVPLIASTMTITFGACGVYIQLHNLDPSQGVNAFNGGLATAAAIATILGFYMNSFKKAAVA